MQNRDNKFETLIKEACGALGLPYQELKDIYKDYPVCLMEYIEKEINERVIEVRFDKEETTISISFDKENICDGSYLFFDNLNDEDLFIEHINERANYDFKRSSWIMADCYLSLKPSKYEMAFCFYK